MPKIAGQVQSTELVETLKRHCAAPHFRASVRAFLLQFGIQNQIDDWELHAVTAAAYLKALETSLREDRRTLKRAVDGL
jgi:hypothetical protein